MNLIQLKGIHMVLNEEILHNKNLNAYEKMILFLLITNDSTELSSDYFIARLGCNQRTLDEAFHHLVTEGYLMSGEASEKENTKNKETGRIIRNEIDYKKVKLTEFNEEHYESAVDALHALIDEPINDRQARIILNIAKGDLDLIKKEYKNAAGSQYSDKLGLLIKALQKQQGKGKNKKDKNESEPPKKTQVNYKSISKLKKYKAYSKDK